MFGALTDFGKMVIEANSFGLIEFDDKPRPSGSKSVSRMQQEQETYRMLREIREMATEIANERNTLREENQVLKARVYDLENKTQ